MLSIGRIAGPSLVAVRGAGCKQQQQQQTASAAAAAAATVRKLEQY